jgi:phage shock protein PspC (stress-responsive transcriptional regulator)
MILEVCRNLESYTGISRLLFQIIFVVWFFNSAWSVAFYFLLSLLFFFYESIRNEN